MTETTTLDFIDLFLHDFNELQINNIYDFDNNINLVDTMHEYSYDNKYDYFYNLLEFCINTNQDMEKRREFLVILYIVNNMNFILEEKKIKENGFDNSFTYIPKVFNISFPNMFSRKSLKKKTDHYKNIIRIILQYMVESINMNKNTDKQHFITMLDIFVNNFNSQIHINNGSYFIEILNSFTTNNKRIQCNINYFIKVFEKIK